MPFLLLPLLLLSPPGSAGKPDMAVEDMREMATHIIMAEVKGIYARQHHDGNYEVTRYVAEVVARRIEKGEGIAEGALVYARYGTVRWTAQTPPPPGTSGHRGVPKEGETLRIYLARNANDGATHDNHDGGFNVLFANGFERPK